MRRKKEHHSCERIDLGSQVSMYYMLRGVHKWLGLGCIVKVSDINQ